ncbi:MAG: NUDIX hydrolase [Actinomycetota bacterium]|nr:NUDIX hydrolase [Actinomycetota bacterium]
MWVKRLQAIAQDGLTYSRDGYDLGRYEQLREIAAEMLAAYSTGGLDEARGLLELQTGPATPKVDVRAAVFDGDAILLIKEPDDGGWALPGGWADVGESPAEAAAREVYEESGYRVRANRLLSVYDRDRHGHPPIPYHVYKLVFLCEIVDHDSSVATEADGIGFFPAGSIPPLSLSRVTPAQIERLLEHHRNPGLPTDFD